MQEQRVFPTLASCRLEPGSQIDGDTTIGLDQSVPKREPAIGRSAISGLTKSRRFGEYIC